MTVPSLVLIGSLTPFTGSAKATLSTSALTPMSGSAELRAMSSVSLASTPWALAAAAKFGADLSAAAIAVAR